MSTRDTVGQHEHDPFNKRVRRVDTIIDTTRLSSTQTRNNRVRVVSTRSVMTHIATPNHTPNI